MKEQCLCLLDSKKDDEVAVPACAQEHERYYPTPPHRNMNGDDQGRRGTFDIDLHVAWQAWHFLTSTFMLRGRLALLDIDLHVAWLARHW